MISGAELDIALKPGKGVINTLDRNYDYSFARNGVYVAGHDGEAGFIVEEGELAKTTVRTGDKLAHVIGDLHRQKGKVLERVVSSNHGFE